MTDLYDRLFPQFPSEKKGEKIAHSVFGAALLDFLQGWSSREVIVHTFHLDERAAQDLDEVLAVLTLRGMDWLTTFQAVCFLAETNLDYTTKADFKARLGLN
jgi:hypothetical protein